MRDEVKLGSLIVGHAAQDAIHVAVAPIVAGQNLKVGEHVSLDSNGCAVTGSKPIGIVDPFLKVGPKKGDKFYLCLYPNTITSLRHAWYHPAFAHTDSQEQERVNSELRESEQWLRNYAIKMNCYDEPDAAFVRLIEGIKSRELFSYGSDLHGFYELDEAEDLRFHAERYLGIRINWDDYTFRCSC